MRRKVIGYLELAFVFWVKNDSRSRASGFIVVMNVFCAFFSPCWTVIKLLLTSCLWFCADVHIRGGEPMCTSVDNCSTKPQPIRFDGTTLHSVCSLPNHVLADVLHPGGQWPNFSWPLVCAAQQGTQLLLHFTKSRVEFCVILNCKLRFIL